MNWGRFFVRKNRNSKGIVTLFRKKASTRLFEKTRLPIPLSIINILSRYSFVAEKIEISLCFCSRTFCSFNIEFHFEKQRDKSPRVYANSVNWNSWNSTVLFIRNIQNRNCTFSFKNYQFWKKERKEKQREISTRLSDRFQLKILPVVNYSRNIPPTRKRLLDTLQFFSIARQRANLRKGFPPWKRRKDHLRLFSRVFSVKSEVSHGKLARLGWNFAKWT